MGIELDCSEHPWGFDASLERAVMATVGPWVVGPIFRQGTVEAAQFVFRSVRSRPEGTIIGCGGEQRGVARDHFVQIRHQPSVWPWWWAERSTDSRMLGDDQFDAVFGNT